MNTVIFSYAPYFAVFGFLAARMYQWGILRDRVAPAAPAVAPATEAALVLGFTTLAGGHLTTALAPGMMRVLLSDPDRVAVIETIGRVGALLFFALLAAWPAAGLRLEEIFPLRAVARRFADAATAEAAPEAQS